ncbi:DNA repair protein [Pedobacter psychrodurus]|uniref:DNA repair protein n=1 Tax=Pedobacter psychrodurus TaxID=2530456 RepID=A0A4R0Q2N5_9SPHI|nr:JAB domain-containing protein [Pedobacter psychrodurus]TCD28613.1 DNA repair protein [Pedobacter psychrodurus]
MENVNYQVAEIEISYRPKFKVAEQPKVTSSDMAFKILLRSWDAGRIELLEEFKVVLLSRQNRVLGVVDISRGGFSDVVTDPKVIFSIALKSCASSLIVSHNHPSGELRPSAADILLTSKLVSGGQILGITVHDHLIVSPYGYFSFKDEDMM